VVKQRLVGALLILPFVGLIAVALGAAQPAGGLRGSLGRLTGDAYTLWFVAGLLGVAMGLRLVLRSLHGRQ